MADETLQRLERLRADTVESARRVLALAQQQLAAHELASRVASEQCRACEAALSRAREGFARATTVLTLRAAEQHAVACAAEVRTATMRAQQAAERRQRHQDQVETRVAELRAAELARRVVSRTVEQRAADVSLRTERREEDERDDQYRASNGPRARRDFPAR